MPIQEDPPPRVRRDARPGFVVQPAFGQLAGDIIHHRNLLVARMKITSYNQPATAGSAPFSEPWSFERNQVCWEEGADDIIQSANSSVGAEVKTEFAAKSCIPARAERRVADVLRRFLPLSPLMGLLFFMGCGGSAPPPPPTTPSLSANVSNFANVIPNATNASYSITVSNAAGAAATSGTVTVTDPPTNFTVTAISGTGWTCALATLTCTRSDALAAGFSYPPITVVGTVTGTTGQTISIPISIAGGGQTTTTNSPGSITIATPYTLGGTVSGLTGTGLVLQNDGGNNLSVDAGATSFTFLEPIAGGSTYSVTVLTQPSSPAQNCLVANGSGTANANVSNVQVTCTIVTYTIGGVVSGLTGTGLVLQDNGGDNLSVSANGQFTFATALQSGANYNVTVFAQPAGQICSATSNSGTVTTAAVTTVVVMCSTPAAINWTDPYQVIDGFGAADAQTGHSMSPANQQFFFGSATGQLGLSLLRIGVTNGSGDPGDCTSVSTSCAGPYVSDMQAIIAAGGRVYASPWSPPAAYKTNGLATCTNNNSGLISSDYAAYATWLANFVQSLQREDGIALDAMSVQNEPNICQAYDSAVWTPADIDTFVGANLGPTFALDGLTTLILVPEGSGYNETSLGNTCAGDPSCNKYVGGINWHDYDARSSGTNTIAADPYPAVWPTGKRYWETEASCGPGYGPNFCEAGFNTDIVDAVDWAAIIDQRLAVDGANAWLYWWLIDNNSTDDQGLMASNGTVPKRAYMVGQYSRFVRPGYFRIGATHLPESDVSVSAYQDLPTNTLVIIATNYSGSAISQTFNITDAPAFSAVTPWITSASMSLDQQANVPVSSNSFTYSLPAQSITTFVGTP